MKASLRSFLKSKNFNALLIAFVLIATAFLFFGSSVNVVAQKGGDKPVGGGEEEVTPTGTPLCGFAWGGTSEGTGMGVGWVSFNSKDCDTDDNGTISSAEASAHVGCVEGPTARHGVTVASNGALNGYAWSSNIGWIKFGGLTGNAPTGAAVQNAVLTGTQLSGWARACAGTENGDCSTMTSRTDGWDGWISLRGSSPAYGVNFNDTTDKFSGYSWGGPVVGWLNWAAASGHEVRYCVADNLATSLEADPSTGVSVLNNVDLTVDMFGTASGNADIRFDCEYNGSTPSYDHVFTNVNVVNNTYTAQNACDYGEPGQYTAFVRVDRGGLQSTATAPISVTSPGVLGAVCTVSSPVRINEQVEWRVDITPNASAVPPYTYEFEFNDNQENPVIPPTSDTFVTVNRVYSTLGQKSVHVTVTDNGGGNAAEDECEATTNVIVNPTIIEI